MVSSSRGLSHARFQALLAVAAMVGSLSWLVVLPTAEGFQAAANPVVGRRRDVGSSQLKAAWSLPTDAAPSFRFKSAWYNEYNPTARPTVYADSYSSLENYSFVTLGDDWPSMATTEETAAAVQQQPRPQRRRINPLKRALRRRARRRSLRRAQSLSQKQW